jgi:septum site-determining protein MinD
VAERADYVLIDCPAGVEQGFKNAAAACREAIVITTPEMSAVRDADRVIGLLNTQAIQPVQLVLNRVRPKMVANQEMLAVDDVTDILALPLLGLVVEDEQVIVSTNRGEPLTLNGTSSPAGRAYMNVARRLRGEGVPLIDPTKERRGLRARLMAKLRKSGNSGGDDPDRFHPAPSGPRKAQRCPCPGATATGAGPRPQRPQSRTA